jgi:hypothetical protein
MHDPLNSGDSLSRSQTLTVGDGGTFSLAVDVPEPSLETEPRHVDLIAARAKLRVEDLSARRTGTNEAIVTVTVTNEGGAAATNVPVALADAAGTVQTPTISTIGAQTTATVETTLDPRGLDNSDSHAVRIDPAGTLPPQAETAPLERTYLVRPGLRVEDVRYREDAERFVRVLVSNSGPARGGATVTVSDGSDTELNTAELSIPPATVEDGQPVPIHRTVDIATPTLTDGQSVAVEIEPDVSNRSQTNLTSVGTVETVLPGEYYGTDGELAVSATGGSLSAGGEGTIEITAENVGQVTIKKLWTDWGVAVDVPSEVLDKRVGEKGTVTLNWATAQPSATPTVTVSVPDRYVGGTYLVDIVASNGNGVKKTTALLSIE